MGNGPFLFFYTPMGHRFAQKGILISAGCQFPDTVFRVALVLKDRDHRTAAAAHDSAQSPFLQHEMCIRDRGEEIKLGKK